MTNEEAIELIHDIQTDAVYSILPEEKEALDMAISALKERPKGEWIDKNGIFNCSLCGYATTSKYDFCTCGADMRKGGAE